MDGVFKKIIQLSIMILGGLHCAYAIESHSEAGNFVGNATPTKYVITVSQIQFHKKGAADGDFVTFISGASDWDIASTSAGSSIGTMKTAATLVSGVYDKLRFVVSKTMTLQGAVASLSDSLPCRTEGDAVSVSDPFGNGSVDTAYLGARDGGAAESETVTVPSGSSVQTSSEFENLGSGFRITIPITFTVKNNQPNFKLAFDVTNAIQFVLRPGTSQCIVFPGPPSMSIGVT